jgi:hypothetical protein
MTKRPLPTSGPIKLSPSRSVGGAIDNGERQKRINAAITEGDFHYENGEYDDTVNSYQHGLKLDPSSTQLKNKLQRAKNAKAAESETK